MVKRSECSRSVRNRSVQLFLSPLAVGVPANRAALLGGTALVALALALPGTARAATNNGDAFGNVIEVSPTATTNTTSTNGSPTNATVDRAYLYTTNVPVGAIVNYAITGAGIALQSTSSTQPVVLINSAGMTNSTGATAGGTAAINLTSSLANPAATVTYSGSGIITNSSGTGAGLATSSGLAATSITTGLGGVVDASAGGARGIDATATLGAITITTGDNVTGKTDGIAAANSGIGTVSITANTGTITGLGGVGIRASSTGGGDVLVQAAGSTSISGSGTNFAVTESATGAGKINGQFGSGTLTGGVFANNTGFGTTNLVFNGTTVNASQQAVSSTTANSLNRVDLNGGSYSSTGAVNVIDVSSTAGGGAQVNFLSGASIAANAGNLNDINATNTGGNGDVVVTTAAGSTINGVAGGTGIFAAQGATGTGAVIVTLGGKIDPPDVGIDAQINNAANGNNVTVHVDNSIDANVTGVNATSVSTIGGGIVVDGAGKIGAGTAPSTFGIDAVQSGAGGGGITITGSGAIAVAATGAGISAQITNAGNASNINVTRTGDHGRPRRGCRDGGHRLCRCGCQCRHHRSDRQRGARGRRRRRGDGRQHRRAGAGHRRYGDRGGQQRSRRDPGQDRRGEAK